MLRIHILYILIFLIITSLSAQDWELSKAAEGIEVYTRKIEGSPLKEYRAEMTVQTDIPTLNALMKDHPSLKDWFDRCTESRRLKKVSDDEFYIYFINDAPWPVQDRDNITHAKFETKADGSQWIYLKAIPDYMPMANGKVRIPNMKAHWEFRPLAQGKIKVIQQAHVDLGGKLPAWMANAAVVDSPFKTMKNLKHKINSLN